MQEYRRLVENAKGVPPGLPSVLEPLKVLLGYAPRPPFSSHGCIGTKRLNERREQLLVRHAKRPAVDRRSFPQTHTQGEETRKRTAWGFAAQRLECRNHAQTRGVLDCLYSLHPLKVRYNLSWSDYGAFAPALSDPGEAGGARFNLPSAPNRKLRQISTICPRDAATRQIDAAV